MVWLWKHGYLMQAHVTFAMLLLLLGLLEEIHVIPFRSFVLGVGVSFVVVILELVMIYVQYKRSK